MPTFLLHHSHRPDECRAAFAAWLGFDSTLRGRRASSTCLTGGHEIWWTAEAPGAARALALLPPFVAARTNAIAVRDVEIP